MSENQLNTEYPKPSAGTFFDGDVVDDIFVFDESSLDNSPTYEGMLQGPGLQSYIDPVAYPIQDEAAFNEWYTQLDESQKAELIALKSEFEQTLALHANTREKLIASVPMLYEAKLPQALELRLKGIDYALGFNQSGCETSNEAENFLLSAGGIEVRSGSLHSHFLMFDQSLDNLGPDSPIAGAIESGFYNDPRSGRFVVAFPEVNPTTSTQNLANSIAVDYDSLASSGVLHPDEKGPFSHISSQYVAGFIDRDGDFWTNSNFAVSDQPSFEKFIA